jgi:hypothetical protein
MRKASLAVVLLVLAACGDETSAPRRDPAVDSLAELRRAMTSGPGMDDAALLALIQRAGTDLWPGTGPDDPVAPVAQKAHQDLAVIAADVARDVARDPAERAAWLARDPDSVAIHDAVLAALAKDVASYRAWVPSEGVALLRRRLERLTAPPPR